MKGSRTGRGLRRAPFLAAMALTGRGPGTPPEAPETEAARERPPVETVLARFPAQLAGFERGVTQDVDPTNPAAGKVVEYVTPGRVAVAHVFVYDMGRPAIRAADLPSEVERAVSEATALPSDRTGRQLSIANRGNAPAAGGDLSCASLEGSFGRTRVSREVCVGVAAGRYLRVQVTMPQRDTPPANARRFSSAAAVAARRS